MHISCRRRNKSAEDLYPKYKKWRVSNNRAIENSTVLQRESERKIGEIFFALHCNFWISDHSMNRRIAQALSLKAVKHHLCLSRLSGFEMGGSRVVAACQHHLKIWLKTLQRQDFGYVIFWRSELSKSVLKERGEVSSEKLPPNFLVYPSAKYFRSLCHFQLQATAYSLLFWA